MISIFLQGINEEWSEYLHLHQPPPLWTDPEQLFPRTVLSEQHKSSNKDSKSGPNDDSDTERNALAPRGSQRGEEGQQGHFKNTEDGEQVEPHGQNNARTVIALLVHLMKRTIYS